MIVLEFHLARVNKVLLEKQMDVQINIGMKLPSSSTCNFSILSFLDVLKIFLSRKRMVST